MVPSAAFFFCLVVDGHGRTTNPLVSTESVHPIRLSARGGRSVAPAQMMVRTFFVSVCTSRGCVLCLQRIILTIKISQRQDPRCELYVVHTGLEWSRAIVAKPNVVGAVCECFVCRTQFHRCGLGSQSGPNHYIRPVLVDLHPNGIPVFRKQIRGFNYYVVLGSRNVYPQVCVHNR